MPDREMTKAEWAAKKLAAPPMVGDRIYEGCGRALQGEPCAAVPCCRVNAQEQGWQEIAPGKWRETPDA